LKECFRADLVSRKDDLVLPLPGQGTAWDEEREYFKQEYTRAYCVNHKHVVRVEDLVEDKGTWFMIMRYYEGDTLSEYMKRQPNKRINEAEMIPLMQKILSGVVAIHEKNIIHRDIKPQNIIMTPDNGRLEPVIIDFGASFVIGQPDRQNGIVATPPYAAIEQQNPTYPVGFHTDVYALGVTAYEMLTGELPQDAEYRHENKLPLDWGNVLVSDAMRDWIECATAVD
ncbi:MAG TPA: hypothetical protein DIW24_04015, partial [Bacteroidetes bacterium]|nr:hypothetical protein [Bacteroidota bacterium]